MKHQPGVGAGEHASCQPVYGVVVGASLCDGRGMAQKLMWRDGMACLHVAVEVVEPLSPGPRFELPSARLQLDRLSQSFAQELHPGWHASYVLHRQSTSQGLAAGHHLTP